MTNFSKKPRNNIVESLTSTRDKTISIYINEVQNLSYKLILWD